MNEKVSEYMQDAISMSSLSRSLEYAKIIAFISALEENEPSWNYVSITFKHE